MNDIGEAVGGLGEAALVGVAAEPAHGGSVPRSGGANCRNCNAEPVGPHCHECGQKVAVHRSLSAIGHDIVHGVLHLDGKFWRTLPLLAFRPGHLMRRYIDGERAKFVSPMALFLFSVFAMFAIFQVAGISAPTDLPANVAGEQANAVEARKLIADKIDALPAEDTAQKADLSDRLVKVDAAIAAIEKGANYSYITADEETVKRQMNLTGIESIDEGLIKKWRQNPSLMLYKLQNNFYKFSWLLIPLSIPFVWILFAWKRRFRAYDHAIFVTYSLAFMSMLFLTLSLLGMAGVPVPILVLSAIFIPPVHIYKQLRRGYDLSRFSALWRMITLTTMIVFVVLVLFLLLLLMLGAI